MQKITPCLWFDGKALEAAEFYVSIFPSSAISRVDRYLEGSPGTPGTVMTVEFSLKGEKFLALNGGPEFKFTPAVSFIVDCETQGEVDHYWARLTEGGEEVQCGWLTDRYGVSWQVTPNVLNKLLTGPDRARAQRVFTAMLGMKKLVIAALLDA